MILKGKIILKGLGLHTGKKCCLTLEPCSATEIILSSGENGLPLRLLSTNGSNRGSDYIFPDGTVVRTCEHVLSALYGLGIYSGVNIRVDGGEMPALDGCAERLCSEILENSEEVEFTAAPSVSGVDPVDIIEPVMVTGKDRYHFVAAYPCSGLHITYVVEYENVGTQIYDYVHSEENYVEDIMRARTFAMRRDIEYLRSHGMALGGSLDNAILIGDKQGEIEAKGGLRWETEFVRHKILDLIGDLSSLGRPLNAHIIAIRAGHELHLRLAEKLKGEMNK